MKEVTLTSLKEAANRLLFDMSEAEYKTLLEEFKTISKQMALIAEDKSVDNYSPMIYPFPVATDSLREDIPAHPESRETILKNAKNKMAGQIKLPKVVS
ncbi:MAG: Asp-tRNA(Asn)/Glu-tRNA(Gln) amidotransferase GatCAB subunit C [Bacilli bacterium]|nr:Asp-tRNA(Asn)/Glu-tRNA(Gln) amidotransferase GatCAB subunit C [Bacilli bacterium]